MPGRCVAASVGQELVDVRARHAGRLGQVDAGQVDERPSSARRRRVLARSSPLTFWLSSQAATSAACSAVRCVIGMRVRGWWTFGLRTHWTSQRAGRRSLLADLGASLAARRLRFGPKLASLSTAGDAVAGLRRALVEWQARQPLLGEQLAAVGRLLGRRPWRVAAARPARRPRRRCCSAIGSELGLPRSGPFVTLVEFRPRRRSSSLASSSPSSSSGFLRLQLLLFCSSCSRPAVCFSRPARR